MGLRNYFFFFFLVTSRNNRLMRRLLSRQGIRYTYRLLTEASFFDVSDENSASENFEMEKKSINNKRKKKQQGMKVRHLRVRFR